MADPSLFAYLGDKRWLHRRQFQGHAASTARGLGDGSRWGVVEMGWSRWGGGVVEMGLRWWVVEVW